MIYEIRFSHSFLRGSDQGLFVRVQQGAIVPELNRSKLRQFGSTGWPFLTAERNHHAKNLLNADSCLSFARRCRYGQPIPTKHRFDYGR